MSRAERNFIPLSKINGNLPREIPIWSGNKRKTKISMEIALPGVDTSHIGINLPRLSRLSRLAGISTVRVMTEDDGLSYTDTKAPSSSHKISGETVFPRASWGDIAIALHTNEINKEIESTSRFESPEEAWADKINLYVQEEILNQGISQLCGERVGMVEQGAVAGTVIPLGRSFTEYMGMNIALNVAESIYTKAKRLSDDTRFSLIAGIQLDRAALLSIWTTADVVLELQSIARHLPGKKS